MKKSHSILILVFLAGYFGVVGQSVTFNYTGSMQQFTVPACVTSITIDARGAEGGGPLGGLGARMVGTFTVTSGEQLNILVGGRGGNDVGDGAGGGGGTFVADLSNNPLIVAGGGGGTGTSVAGNPGNITVTGTNGTQPISGGVGGTNGGGGGGASDNGSCISGCGGGGFCGNGGEASNGGSPGNGGSGCVDGSNGSSGSLCPSGIGLSYLNGGAGGTGCVIGGCTPVSGGYGGGGGTAGGGGAGGGGYSGGGGGGWNSGTPSGGGGGGSYNNGANQNNTTGFQSGDGEAIISWVTASGILFATKDSTGATCNGDNNGTATANPTGGTSPYTYLWTPTAQTNATATGLSAGTYTITVTDAGGCSASTIVSVTQPNPVSVAVTSIPADSACAGQNVILNVAGANNYTWSTGATNTSITVVIPVGDTAYYWVKGSIGLCNDSIPFKIKIIPAITASISAVPDTICPHQNTILTAQGMGGQVTYRWSTGATISSITVNDTLTTTYTVTVYGICDSMKEMKTVTVIALPKPVVNGTLWKCKGALGDTLTVTSSVNPTKYIWSNGNTSSTYITGTINGDSIIYVTAENSLGCSVKDSFKITERLYPTANVKYISGCGTEATQITATPFGTGPFTYLWNTGGTNDTIDVFITDTTTFNVIISNGCPITKTITAVPYVPTLIACCNSVINIGSDTILSASGAGIMQYQWQPPNSGLSCYTCATVTATPTVTTTYTVTGTDAQECQTQKIITVVVETPCLVDSIPNVFTPSNGGSKDENNLFYINTSYLDSWSIIIYDRWGKEMFKTINPHEYWNGNTESGGTAPAGIYYYLINATCPTTTFKKQGYVQLIR